MTPAAILFYVFAALCIFSSVAMLLLARNVVAGALCLVVTMVSLAGIFVLLGAEFLGVVQIIVYAGAIMVLLLFVIMLLDFEVDEFGPEPPRRALLKAAGGGIAIAVGGALAVAFVVEAPQAPLEARSIGGHHAMGRALFSDFVLPLEVLGLLLLAGIVGAVIVAKRAKRRGG